MRLGILRDLPLVGIVFVTIGLIFMIVGGVHYALPAGWGQVFVLIFPQPTRTPEPLIPTRTPSSTQVFATPPASVSMPRGGSSQFTVPPEEHYRVGISLPGGITETHDLSALGVGWVMDWYTHVSPTLPSGIEYVQTVRMRDGLLIPDPMTLTLVASANPGATWLIGNEPDVRWQDNVLPTTYARLYHEAYIAIKWGDPSAIVAAGGIAQPTPLRLRYLDLVLDTYLAEFGEPLPAEAWQIHNYMLREMRDAWGVDIPPGIPDDTGLVYEIEDSGNMAAFQKQIVNFRRWMLTRGYGGLPLIVSEYGIPMPPDYGFPVERVGNFLSDTWRFFLTAKDPVLGNPQDDGRLVQRWCWFSMSYPLYPTGNLVDPVTGQWTPLAYVWMSYIEHPSYLE